MSRKILGAVKLLLTQSIRKAALISTAAWRGRLGNNMGAIGAMSGVWQDLGPYLRPKVPMRAVMASRPPASRNSSSVALLSPWSFYLFYSFPYLFGQFISQKRIGFDKAGDVCEVLLPLTFSPLLICKSPDFPLEHVLKTGNSHLVPKHGMDFGPADEILISRGGLQLYP